FVDHLYRGPRYFSAEFRRVTEGASAYANPHQESRGCNPTSLYPVTYLLQSFRAIVGYDGSIFTFVELDARPSISSGAKNFGGIFCGHCRQVIDIHFALSAVANAIVTRHAFPGNTAR